MQSTIPESALSAVQKLGNRQQNGDGQILIKRLPMTHGASGEVDTNWDLPAGSILLDVFVKVDTAEVTGSTKTVDVGLLSSESGGDADAFADGLSVAATGIKVPAFVVTAGTNDYLGAASTHTIGAKFTQVLLAGLNTGASDPEGAAVKGPHLADSLTAKSVTYTRGDTFSEFKGELVLVYMVFHNNAVA